MYQGRKRKLNRLKNFNYADPGFYFITICVKNRVECLGEIRDARMVLNESGEMVKKQWLWLADQFNYVGLDEWIIMLNHLHGILQIKDININNDHYYNKTIGNVVGTGRDLSLRTKIKPLSDIVGAFKTTASKSIHLFGFPEFQWQRSFYDHIVRNAKDFYRIKKYIQENPINWEIDRNNKENLYI